MSDSKKPTLKCPICKKGADFRCSACNQAGYCSREHQKEHWKTHKTGCIPYKVCESSSLGRHLIASRDIKAGDVIINEKPLLIIPPRITLPICLYCYSELEGNDSPAGNQTKDLNFGLRSIPCEKGCGWPLCDSPECILSRNEDESHDAECQISIARGGIKISNFGCDHPVYQSIGFLRASYLQDKNPKAYEKFIHLVSNVDAKNKLLENVEDDERKAEFRTQEKTIQNSLLHFFNLKNLTTDWIEKVFGIIESNGHEIPIPVDENSRFFKRMIGIYDIVSFLEHNCIPNCCKIFINTNEIQIRASRLIKKDEHLSISYCDPLWGTNDRINFLQMSKYFTCKCKRCTDNTELGQHISSIRCPQCKNYKNDDKDSEWSKGLVVPSDPFDPASDWNCNTCKETYPCRYASTIFGKIGKEIEEMKDVLGKIFPEENFLEKFHKVLPPYSFYFLEIKVGLAQLYGRLKDDPLNTLSIEKLERKISLCNELINVFNVILPGYSRLRALILYELQAATSMMIKIKKMRGELTVEKHLEEILQCIEWLKECVKVLSWEPKNTSENKRALGAKQELAVMKIFAQSLQTQIEPSVVKIDGEEFELF